MNSWITFSSCLESCLLSASPVYRRQLFLIRSLGGYCCKAHMEEGQGAAGGKASAFEADTETVIRRISPVLDPKRYKGQAGKIAVIGGCREYTGAPYFAAISALKIGADLSHVFCTKDAAPVIKGYSPELIVHPVLEESYSVRDEEKPSVSQKVLAEVSKWMERFDCIVVGPGLGRDPFLLDCVSDIMRIARQSNIPTVVDGDGLFLVTNNLDLVSGHSLAVLTPNVNEYKRLVEKVLNCEVNEEAAHEQLLSLAKQIGGVTILRKGKSDLISDGVTVNKVSIFGSPRRCGGQGDILSGSVAIFSSWARAANKQETDNKSASSPMVLGCIAGSALLRRAASLAFATKKRATLTSDIIECLGRTKTLAMASSRLRAPPAGRDEGILARAANSSIVLRSKKAAASAGSVAKKLMWSTGRAAWIAGTSFLVLALPLIIEMDREQQLTEFEQQQATILGAPLAGPPPPTHSK